MVPGPQDLRQAILSTRSQMLSHTRGMSNRPAESEFAKYGLPAFVPPDLSRAEVGALARARAVEVIVKNAHTGTSKHRYHGRSGSTVRPSHPTLAGALVEEEHPYPAPIVRFDWRNPLVHPDTGARLADEILPEPFADWFLDVERARATALQVNRALVDYLAARPTASSARPDALGTGHKKRGDAGFRACPWPVPFIQQIMQRMHPRPPVAPGQKRMPANDLPPPSAKRRRELSSKRRPQHRSV